MICCCNFNGSKRGYWEQGIFGSWFAREDLGLLARDFIGTFGIT